MAFPTILVNSTGGSDTAASGAGPSTAISGTTNASTSGTGLVVTLPASTVLTSVLTDGSHAIFLNDATAGARNFGKITATAGSGGATPTVTVSDAFGVSLSGKSWAIGGKRATVAGTNSLKLFDNNSVAGDAMPGWSVEMQSGHAETIAAPIIFRRDGNETSGPITLRGTSGAATLPLLTFSNNARAIDATTTFPLYHVVLANFELENSNATKTASVAVDVGSINYQNAAVIVGIKVSVTTPSRNFYRGIIPADTCIVRNCTVAYCAGNGIDGVAASFSDTSAAMILWNVVRNCGGHGITIDSTGKGQNIHGNVCYSNTGDGIRVINCRGVAVTENTCDSNGGSGFYLTLWSTGTVIAANNIASLNSAYGFNLAGATADSLGMLVVSNNNTYNNTSGAYSTSGVATGDPAVNPNYAGSGNYTPANAALQAALAPPGY